MRTDEHFLTQIALMEIACPSEKDCPNAGRCSSTDEGAYQEAGVGWMRAVHERRDEMVRCVTQRVLEFYTKLLGYRQTMLGTVPYGPAFRKVIIAPDEKRMKLLIAGVDHCKFHLCTSYGELVRTAEARLDLMVRFVGPRIPDED